MGKKPQHLRHTRLRTPEGLRSPTRTRILIHLRAQIMAGGTTYRLLMDLTIHQRKTHQRDAVQISANALT